MTKRFDMFQLDVANQSLWRGRKRVALMPKPFAVLIHLVEHAGRPVSRQGDSKSRARFRPAGQTGRCSQAGRGLCAPLHDVRVWARSTSDRSDGDRHSFRAHTPAGQRASALPSWLD